MLLASYFHRLDPIIFTIPGLDLPVRWYGLSYAIGFILAFWLLRVLAKRKRLLLTVDEVGDFMVPAIIGTLVGGRFGYVLFYKPELLWMMSDGFPWWGVLEVNKGGMASHGGIIGMVAASVFYAWRKQISGLHLTDLFAFTVPIGVFFGRVANFINGELYGRPSESSLPWITQFPQEIHSWVGTTRNSFAEPEKLAQLHEAVRHLNPAQLPEHFSKFIPSEMSAERWQLALDEYWGRPGARDFVDTCLNALVEQSRGNEAVVAELVPLVTMRHPSQIYAALLEGVLIFVVMLIVWRRARKPGVVTAWCVMGYAVVRIFNEAFRMPDEHLGLQLFDLTRGQWLSIGMLMLGGIFLAFLIKRKDEAIGGWGSGGVDCGPLLEVENESEQDDEEAKA